MLRELKSGSIEDEILNRKPSPPPSDVAKVTLFLYGSAALGYAAFRLAVSLFNWAASRQLLFGFVGVLGLLCLGPCVVWLYMTQRRIFGGLEFMTSVVGAFHYALKLRSGFDPAVLISLTGMVFLFVKGINDLKSNRPL